MGEAAAQATGEAVRDPRALAERVGRFAAEQLGVSDRDLRVEGLRRLAGGASRESWALDLVFERDGSPRRLELVLRRDPPGRVGDGGDRVQEFRVLRAAAAGGVPVPRVHWACRDPGVLGSPFFLMDRVAGEALPRRLLRDPRYARARASMAAELGALLARIHALDLEQPDLADLDAPPPDRTPARAAVEQAGAAIRALAAEPHPVLDWAERWLLERAPAPPRLTLVHGDYRVGNVLFDESGVRSILDWELVHRGDPVEDLGWLCTAAWRFGSSLPVGGVGTREALVEAYEAASGWSVDRAALRFWEACGSFRVALVFITQARVYLDGRVRSVELAALGRRTAEAEQALLGFLAEDA